MIQKVVKEIRKLLLRNKSNLTEEQMNRMYKIINPDNPNYKISELLLNKEYVDAITTGKSNNNMKWAGLNLNNLGVSIIDVYKRDELSKLKNFSKEIIEFVNPYLEKIRMTHEKTTLERFIN